MDKLIGAGAAVAVALAAALPARAQTTYPEKPIRIVIGTRLAARPTSWPGSSRRRCRPSSASRSSRTIVPARAAISNGDRGESRAGRLHALHGDAAISSNPALYGKMSWDPVCESRP